MAAPTTTPYSLPEYSTHVTLTLSSPIDLLGDDGEALETILATPHSLPEFSSDVTLTLSSPIDLLDDDSEVLETIWHRYAMNLLIDCVMQHLHDRTDYFVGGNMFIYYNEQQARNRDYRGPDFFFVWGRPLDQKRRWYATWEEEGHFPNVIIELMSPTTRRIDLGPKKSLYQNTFKTEDYFCYDPLKQKLFGWTLTSAGYVQLEPNESGWLWCEQLQLWLGKARSIIGAQDDIFLRFFTSDGKLVGSRAEVALDERDAARQELEAARDEVERAQTDAERERQRAELAEAELALLKAEFTLRDKPAS